ncbi:MAG: hypothetical protein GXY55_02355 [Phycisphaerae bacterium]|nr:hypothetical protein [Phycisphaerae bacterium]
MKRVITFMVVFGIAGMASAAVTGTYMPATPANTGPAEAITLDPSQWANGGDNLWAVCNVWDSSLGLDSFSAIGEPAPTITTTVTGLDPAGMYDVYLLFNAYDGASIQGAIAGNALELCTFANSTNTGFVPFTGFALLEHRLGTVSGSSFAVDIAPHGPESYYVGLSYVAVPEPVSLVLLALGALLLRRKA